MSTGYYGFEKNTHTFEFERHVSDTSVSIVSFGMLQVCVFFSNV